MFKGRIRAFKAKGRTSTKARRRDGLWLLVEKKKVQ